MNAHKRCMVDSAIHQEFGNGLPVGILNLHLWAETSSLVFLYSWHQWSHQAPSLPGVTLYQDTATVGTDIFEERLATTRQCLVITLSLSQYPKWSLGEPGGLALVSVRVSLVRDEDKAAVIENSEHSIHLYPVFKGGRQGKANTRFLPASPCWPYSQDLLLVALCFHRFRYSVICQ